VGGLLVSGGEDGVVRLWTLGQSGEGECIASVHHGEKVRVRRALDGTPLVCTTHAPSSRQSVRQRTVSHNITPCAAPYRAHGSAYSHTRHDNSQHMARLTRLRRIRTRKMVRGVLDRLPLVRSPHACGYFICGRCAAWPSRRRVA